MDRTCSSLLKCSKTKQPSGSQTLDVRAELLLSRMYISATFRRSNTTDVEVGQQAIR